ncbi:PilN domain-containing protein [Dielma fastidiosa]|uniref:PilN domain-containing protein n=1 Tax=Dielma fastidiosa TaxID=1034346 RepID=A0AB35UN67_9FIRM|nr:PilN domain-containing protein [Dielma fastidiosa]MDY5166555.1 PilN domain-containing protein [Dielma fastidiosa]
MILVILFEGQYIRFYQFSDNPHDLELKKSSVIDLNEKEIYNDDVYDLTKLEAIVRDEVKKQKYPRKNVKILLNNRQLILRELSVPMGNEDETQTMVANEMIMSLNLSNDYVVTYTKLGNTNENGIEEQRVFASAIQEKTLAGYKQMMKACRLRCSSIQTSTANLLQYLCTVEKDKTVLFVEYNTDHVRSFLFEKGNFILLRTLKDIIEYRDEEAFTQSLFDNIAKMDQFQFTRNRYQPIEEIQIFGNNPNLETFKKLDQDSGRPITLLDKPIMMRTISNYYQVLAGACALFDTHTIGFLPAYGKKSKSREKIKNKSKNRLLMTAVVSLLLMGLACGSAFAYDYYLQSKLNEITVQITQREVPLQEANQIINEFSSVNSLDQTLTSIQDMKDLTVKLTPAVSALLTWNKSGDIQIASAAYANQVLELNGIAVNNTDCAAYARLLDNSGLFYTVSYTGFEAREGGYEFVMTAILKGSGE